MRVLCRNATILHCIHHRNDGCCQGGGGALVQMFAEREGGIRDPRSRDIRIVGPNNIFLLLQLSYNVIDIYFLQDRKKWSATLNGDKVFNDSEQFASGW